MKRVIDGKRFDTDKAEFIGAWSNELHSGNFHCCEETLYVTTSGQHFLHGEGGGHSKYASAHGDSRGWGESIVPMSPDEAFTWASSHLPVGQVEKFFGEMIKDA